MYILLRVGKEYSVSDVQQNLRRRLPEVDVLTREEFAHKSRMYWVIKTGAGSAILTAAVLGFLIGLVVVSQTIYANTMENIRRICDVEGSWSLPSFCGSHRAHAVPDLRRGRKHSGPARSGSGHELRKISDSVDSYSVVAACDHGGVELADVLIGLRRFRSKRTYS